MPGPGRIYEAVERFRGELLRGERAVASDIIRAYGQAWQRLRVEIETLTRRYYETQDAGEEVRPSWLFQKRRLDSLLAQVETELSVVMQSAEASVRAQQLEVVTAAGRHVEELARLGAGRRGAAVTVNWNRLPVEALSSLVGFSADGSPLGELLGKLPGEAGQAVRRGLIEGLALGQNPRQIARNIRGDLGGNLARALTISRTEVLRSYRESTHQNYLANSEVLDGWIWLAAKQARTCIACLMLDGTIHPLSERLVDHPNGRCVPCPIVKGAELPRRQTGAQWLEKQPEDVQRRVLGDASYEAWKAGAVDLADFVGRKTSREWGTTRYARSLSDILGPERAKQYRQPGYRVLAQRIEAFEREVVNFRHEVARVWDARGKVVVEKTGTATHVSFTPQEKQAMRNCVFTHNHPGGWTFAENDVRRAGCSFSREDVQFAAEAEVREMRAVSPGYIHIIRPSAGGWDANWAQAKLIPEYRKQDHAVRLDFLTGIVDGRMTPEEAEVQHFHEVWTRVAKSLSLDYTRRRRA